MMKDQTQKGSIFVVILIVLFMVIVAALGFVYWNNNYMQPKDGITTNSSDATPTDSTVADPYAGWKTFNSPTSSGISFKYPPNWSFTPPKEEFTNRDGGVRSDYVLYSQPPEIDKSGPAPKLLNQFMCVTISEYKGEWQYHVGVLENKIGSEEFNIGDTHSEIVMYKDYTLDRQGKPMGNILRVKSVEPVSSQGALYVNANNGYVFSVTAQYNCIQGGEGIEDLDADFNAQPATKDAILVIKSLATQ